MHLLEASLFDSLIRTNTRTRIIQAKEKEKNTMREKEMKECVCAEPCEGMLEDMPVTYFPTSEKQRLPSRSNNQKEKEKQTKGEKEK